jgi:hypothetical protein
MRFCALLLAAIAALGVVAASSTEASDQAGTTLATTSTPDTWGWG